MTPTIPIKFDGPAWYKIIVQGKLSESWRDQFEIENYQEDQEGNYFTTSFTCHIDDQATLSGILNRLYQSHIPILSIECINSKKTIHNET